VSLRGNFADVVTEWAAREPSVRALVLIGSQVRSADDAVWRADAQSDWDFIVITSRPAMFADATWTRGLAGAKLLAYAARSTRVGRVPKANTIFAGAEADFVAQPARLLRVGRMLMTLGWHRRDGWLRRSLQDLAVVIRPGWKFLKGAEDWEPFYQRVVAEVSDARLSDGAARSLADVFVCDWLWVMRRIDRGELHAAQRWLHRELAEVNFRLLHELKLRRGERSFPEARRIERVAATDELGTVTVDAALNTAALRAAVEKSAQTLRGLMGALMGDAWRWPDLE